MSVYTNQSVVYEASTARYLMAAAADTIVISNLQVGNADGGLTINTGGAADLSIAETGLTRVGNIALNTGASALVTLDGGLTVAGNASVGGNLTVAGDIISSGTQNVIIKDSFLDLNSGNTLASGATAVAGGFTVQFSKAPAFGTPVAVVAFHATGSTFNAGPYIEVGAGAQSVFAVGDIIAVSGQIDPGSDNNGLFAVLDKTTSGQIALVATPDAQVPFIQTALSNATATAAAIVYPVSVGAFALSNGILASIGPVAVTLGTPCYASGTKLADIQNKWVNMAAVSVSLQSAYNGGSTIAMVNGSDIAVTAPVSGTAAVSLKANKASDFTVAGASLTLAGTGSGGSVAVSSAASTVSIDGQAGVSVNSTGGAIAIGDGANNNAINIGTAGNRTISIGKASGTTAVQINGSGATSYFKSDSGNLQIQTTTLGAIQLQSSGSSSPSVHNGGISLYAYGTLPTASAYGVTLNVADGKIGIGTDGDANGIDIGTAGARATIIGAQSGASSLALKAGSSGMTLDSDAAVSIDAATASNFTVSGNAQALTLSATGTGSGSKVIIAGSGSAGTAGVSVESSAGNIDIGVNAVAGAINIGTGASTRTISIGSTTSTAASVTASGNVSLTSATGDVVLTPTAAGKSVELAGFAKFDSAAGVVATVGATIAAGQLCYTDASSTLQLSDNDLTGALEVECIAVDGASSGSIRVASVAGTTAYVKFLAPPTAGNIAYLSATAGSATDVAPTTKRVFRIGKVLSGTAVNTLYPVRLGFQYIIDLP